MARWPKTHWIGNVWCFGEATAEFENGVSISTAGSFVSGVDFAKPGIIMLATPSGARSNGPSSPIELPHPVAPDPVALQRDALVARLEFLRGRDLVELQPAMQNGLA